jgi:hypothetical protein
MVRTISITQLVVVLFSGLASAQFRTVTVQNANNNPVPTTIQGTPTVAVSGTVPVSISGTPAVSINGTVPVSGSVSITGTPGVSVTNLPTGTAGPANTTGVAMKDLDDPGRQPFQTLLACTTGPSGTGTNTCEATSTLQGGKAFVIEYIMTTATENNSNVQFYNLQTSVGGIAPFYLYGPGTHLDFATPVNDHLVRIYADPGSTMKFGVITNSNLGSVFATIILSGHLVNAP